MIISTWQFFCEQFFFHSWRKIVYFLYSTNLPSSIRGCDLHHSIMGADHAHSPIWSLQISYNEPNGNMLY